MGVNLTNEVFWRHENLLMHTIALIELFSGRNSTLLDVGLGIGGRRIGDLFAMLPTT